MKTILKLRRFVQKHLLEFLSVLFLAQNCLAQTVLPLCYLNQFKPDNFPWKMDDCLNYEEVFKNFQYTEARWQEAKKMLVIRHFKQGQYSDPVTYFFKNKLLIEQP